MECDDIIVYGDSAFTFNAVQQYVLRTAKFALPIVKNSMRVIIYSC